MKSCCGKAGVSMKESGCDRPMSVWMDSSTLPGFESLKTDLNTEVLIIGGGIAGILCAYMLKQAGVEYVLVEADTICSGITKNTTAKITVQHGLVYHKLVKQFGMDKAALYFRANQEALETYTELCAGIDCDFERKDSFVYSLDNPRAIADELECLQKLNIPAEYVQQLPLPLQIEGAVKFARQAQFHPLKFIREIARNLNIYENTMVKRLEGCKAHTEHGSITAKKVVVATHFPFLNQHGSYFLKMYQHRSYEIAFENAPDFDGMYVDESQKGMSFRNYNGLLLVGGGGCRTGKAGGNWAEIESFSARNFPGAKARNRWSTQDCMTLDSVPYIGNYSKNTPNLFVATGFNKWGMTSSMVSALLLTDLITGKKSPYASVFSPSRSIIRPQLAINALEATKNLLTISSPRCPHMGCALKWNQAEHSWDCPCHGSRFTRDGDLIDNPATADLKRRRS